MKCPLVFTTTDDNFGNIYISGADCLEEECAWWNKFTLECAIYMLALEINALRAATQDIKNKMPHEAQFRK